MDGDSQTPITWNSELEKFLAEEGEKALGSSWIHNQCETYYAGCHQRITIPSIILSTVSGAGSIGFSGGPNNTNASLIIGAISLLVGLLQTLSSFWGFSKLQEAHRNADIQWAKLHRFIAVEMTLPRSERFSAKDMLKICRDSIERLSETSPLVPDNILLKFNEKFGKDYPTVAVPDIANGLRKIVINTHSSPHGSPTFHLNNITPQQNGTSSGNGNNRSTDAKGKEQEAVLKVSQRPTGAPLEC